MYIMVAGFCTTEHNSRGTLLKYFNPLIFGFLQALTLYCGLRPFLAFMSTPVDILRKASRSPYE